MKAGEMDSLYLAAADLTTRVQGWIEAGGYAMLFGLLFACGLGLPLPEDVPLLLSGFFIYHGKMHLLWAGIFAWCGIIGGDIMLYNLGKRYGMNITRVPFIGKHVTEGRIHRAQTLFEKYGVWVVAVGRLFAGIRGGMVVAAGTLRYNFVKFIIADGLAALVSGGLWIWGGYYGAKWIGDPATIMQRAEPYKRDIALGLLLLVMVVIFYIVWRKRKHATLSDLLAERVEKRPGHCADGTTPPQPDNGGATPVEQQTSEAAEPAETKEK